LLNTVLRQNYCQFADSFYQPEKGVAVGSPISSIVVEIFLQYYEENTVKYHLENKRILFYNRYVDDILIIFDSSRITIEKVHTYIKNVHHQLTFKPTPEENNAISYLDLTITRLNTSIDINIFRKPTTTDTTIHYTSNRPVEHKLAAFRFMVDRLNNLPLTPEAHQQEKNIIRHMAINNGYPVRLIDKLQHKTITDGDHTTQKDQQIQKWVIFRYHSPLIRKVTNNFKNTNLRIA
jgi:hypothetical protein